MNGQKSLTHTAAGGALSSRCTTLDPHSHGVHSEVSPTSRAGRNFPTPFPCQESRELQGNPGLCSPSMDPQLLGQGLQVCPLVCNCLQLQCLLMRDVPVCPELQALSGLSCLHAHWNRCDPCHVHSSSVYLRLYRGVMAPSALGQQVPSRYHACNSVMVTPS